MVLGGPARNRWDADEMIAVGALDFAAGELRVTLQVSVAVGTREFEFVHRFQEIDLVFSLRI